MAKFAKARVEGERFDVGTCSAFQGQLTGVHIVNMGTIRIHERIRNEKRLVGVCDSEGVVSGDVVGRIQEDGTVRLDVKAVSVGAHITIDYEYMYALPREDEE